MGGKKEVELEIRKCLLYCLHFEITVHILPHHRKLFIFSHVLLESQMFHIYCCFHFFHILESQLLLASCFSVFSAALLLQLPCFLQISLTQIYMYTFVCIFFLTVPQPSTWQHKQVFFHAQWLG